MQNKNNTKSNQHQTVVTVLMIFTLAAFSFAAGFYFAAMIIAAMLTN